MTAPNDLSTLARIASRDRTNRRIAVERHAAYLDGWVRGSLVTSVCILVAGALIGVLLFVILRGWWG